MRRLRLLRPALRVLPAQRLTAERRARFKGLSHDEMLVFQLIQQSGNMGATQKGLRRRVDASLLTPRRAAAPGIWTKDLKIRSNLQQPQARPVRVQTTRWLCSHKRPADQQVSQVAGAAQADQGGQERGQQQPQGLHAVRAGAEPRDHRRCLVRSLACSCRASAPAHARFPRYTGHEYDSEFIHVLRQECHKYIKREKRATLGAPPLASCCCLRMLTA